MAKHTQRRSVAPDPISRGIEVTRLDPCMACSVRDMSVCGELRPTELSRLAEITTQFSIKKKSTIFWEGDPSDYVFNLTSGSVKIYKSLADGRQQITGFLFAGDFLGLAHINRCVYTAEAITEVRLCRFNRGALQKLCEDFPHFERRLLLNASNELAAAQDHMMLLGQKSAKERLATFLLNLSERARRRGVNEDLLDLPMLRTDIAEFLGSVPETISRNLGKLVRARLIEIPHVYKVAIIDRVALAEAAGLEVDETFVAEIETLSATG